MLLLADVGEIVKFLKNLPSLTHAEITQELKTELFFLSGSLSVIQFIVSAEKTSEQIYF